MPQILVRPALPAEAETIRDLVCDAYEKYASRIGRQPAPMQSAYHDLVAEDRVWVAYIERIVGILVLMRVESSMLVENVAVLPSRQGQGIGRTLMAFAEAKAREWGLETLELYTNERMVENIGFYLGLGYRETARRTEDGLRRIYYRKRLAKLERRGESRLRD